jgi:hypothetical protein
LGSAQITAHGSEFAEVEIHIMSFSKNLVLHRNSRFRCYFSASPSGLI